MFFLLVLAPRSLPRPALSLNIQSSFRRNKWGLWPVWLVIQTGETGQTCKKWGILKPSLDLKTYLSKYCFLRLKDSQFQYLLMQSLIWIFFLMNCLDILYVKIWFSDEMDVFACLQLGSRPRKPWGRCNVNQPAWDEYYSKPSFLLASFDNPRSGIIYKPYILRCIKLAQTVSEELQILFNFQVIMSKNNIERNLKPWLQQNLTYGPNPLTLEKPNWKMITGWLAGWPETCGKVVICAEPPIFKMTHLKQIAAC